MPSTLTEYGRLYYDQHHAHNDAPTVIYIHGAGGMRYVWGQQLMNPSSYNAVRLDLPGHGDSDPAPQPLSMQLYMESVLAFMDALNIERAAIAGHSMGAGVALQMALDYPGRTLGAVCVNGAANMRLRLDMLRAIPGEVRRGIDDALALLLPAWIMDTTDHDNEHSYLQFLRMNPRVLLHDYRICHQFDIVPHLPDIQAPILVIGADYDHVYTFSQNRRVFDRAPHAQLVRIPDEGHFIPGEKPDRLTEEITVWLAGQVIPMQTTRIG